MTKNFNLSLKTNLKDLYWFSVSEHFSIKTKMNCMVRVNHTPISLKFKTGKRFIILPL